MIKMGEACLICKQIKYPLVRSSISQYFCELLYAKSSILKSWGILKTVKPCWVVKYRVILDFKLSPSSECYVLSFGWFCGIWILCADVSEHSVCSVFIGGVIRKNNRDYIAWVFVQVKFWLENNLSQSDGGQMGRGCPSRGTGCSGQWLLAEACSMYVWEKWPCVRARKRSHWMVVV